MPLGQSPPTPLDGDRTGFDRLYTAVTAGASYHPYPSILLRPEIRIDHNDSSRAFENKSDLFTATYSVIVVW